jgi:pyruvate formate lyase activating enzyme
MLITLMKKGIVFDIKKYAIHDGPGIRTTVFLKGCPLHCWWCHNPEGQNPKPELVYRKNRCIGCGECVKTCPEQAISLKAQHIKLNRKNCILCSNCTQVCPSDALSIAGKQTTVKEVVEEIEKDRTFYDESGGGVTFSGGEPFQQPIFLNQLLTQCKKRDIHTTVNTCGHTKYETINKMRSKIDLFLYDIKKMNPEKHAKYTGASNTQILNNLKNLANNGSTIMINFPIIPTINDDNKNIEDTAKLISSLPNIERVNILPYHKAGIEKYRSLGKPYKLNKIQPPSNQKIQTIKKKIEAAGIKVEIGGG